MITTVSGLIVAIILQIFYNYILSTVLCSTWKRPAWTSWTCCTSANAKENNLTMGDKTIKTVLSAVRMLVIVAGALSAS